MAERIGFRAHAGVRVNDPDAEPQVQGFSRRETEALSRVGRRRTIAPQTLLCQEGEVPRNFFVLTAGRVEIGKTLLGQSVSLRTSGPGSVLALMPALEGVPCSVSIRAAEDAVLIEVSRDDLLEMLAKDHDQGLDLVLALSVQAIRRLRSSTDELALAVYRTLRGPMGPAHAVDLAQVQAGNHAW